MGGWAGGTDQELIKSMNKKIATARRARADKDADQSPEPDTKMSSAEPVVKTPAAKQLPASSIRKRLSRTAALRRSEEDDSSRTATESPRLGPREIPDSVSPEPPKKKARILDKVEVQTLKPPAKQSDLYQFFGSKRKLPEPKAKSPIEDYTDVAFKPTRFQQGKPPDSHTYKVLIRSESRNGSRFKDAFSGAETDDSAAKQLKNESESTKPKEKSGRRITGGQTPGKWSTYSGNKNGKWSSKKSFPRGGSSDDDLLAPGSSHKTPRYPSPRHPSNRQTPIASNRKRRAAPKTMSETAEFEVESIVAHRFVDGRKQYYVKWVNFGPNDNTWEPEENLDGSLGLVEDYESTLVDDL